MLRAKKILLILFVVSINVFVAQVNAFVFENAKFGLSFSSGVAATDAVIKLLSPGDEVIAANDMYGGTYRLFSKVFEKDADFTNVMGVSRTGRTAIEDLHEPLFKTIWAFSTLTITDSKIRMIKPDVVAVDAWWDLEGLKTPDGIDCQSRNGLLNFIMTKKNNEWLIAIMHNMDLPGSKKQKC